MGIARGWEKRVIRTNITYAKRTVRIFSVSPQSRSLFSASFQTFCLTARAYLNTQNTDCFAVYFEDGVVWSNTSKQKVVADMKMTDLNFLLSFFICGTVGSNVKVGPI